MKQSNNLRLTITILLILLLVASVLFALYKINTKKNYDIISNIIKNDSEYVIESASLGDMINYLFADDFKKFNQERLKNYSQIQNSLYALYADTVVFEKIKQAPTVIATYSNGDWILLIKQNFKASQYTDFITGSLLGYTYISPKKINKKILGLQSDEISTAIFSMSNTSIFKILEKSELDGKTQWISHDFYFSNTTLEIISFYIPASKDRKKLSENTSSIIKTFAQQASTYNYKYKNDKAISKLTRKANIENKISVEEIGDIQETTEAITQQELNDVTDESTGVTEISNINNANQISFFSTNSNIVFGPQHVQNHTNTQGNIILQDADNEISYITTDGNKKWSFKADGRIIGDITEVDFYNNDKIQYMFNTTTRLYLLDINGNHVKGFPIIIPVKAKNQICMLISNSNKFDLFYIGIDDVLYMLSNSNNDLKLNKKIQDVKPTVKPVQIIDINKNTYIAYLNNKNNITFLYSNGNAYFTADNAFTPSNNFIVYENKTNSKGMFLTNDKTGRVSYINKGKSTVYTEFNKYDQNNYFFYEDVDKDNKNDFIFINNGKVECFDRFKKTIFSETVDIADISNVKCNNTNNEVVLIISSNIKSSIVIFNKKSKKVTKKTYNASTPPAVTNIGTLMAEQNRLILK